MRRIQIGRCSCRQQGLLPRRFASLTFIARHRILNSTTLAHMLDSLVRVSRRGVCSHLLSTEKPSTQLPRNIPTHPRRDLHSVLLPPEDGRTDTQHNSPPVNKKCAETATGKKCTGKQLKKRSPLRQIKNEKPRTRAPSIRRLPQQRIHAESTRARVQRPLQTPS